MSDQEAKEIKTEAREIMPQPSSVNCSFHSQLTKPAPLFVTSRADFAIHDSLIPTWNWMAAMVSRGFRAEGMDECLALADLGASINLMPFSVWEKLSLPDLTPTCMTNSNLGSIEFLKTIPSGIAKDISMIRDCPAFIHSTLILRGHFILEAILNSEPPLPPPVKELISRIRTELKLAWSCGNFSTFMRADFSSSFPNSLAIMTGKLVVAPSYKCPILELEAVPIIVEWIYAGQFRILLRPRHESAFFVKQEKEITYPQMESRVGGRSSNKLDHNTEWNSTRDYISKTKNFFESIPHKPYQWTSISCLPSPNARGWRVRYFVKQEGCTSQVSKRDKSRLGYGDQVHDGVLSYKNEVFQSVFDSRSSDVEDSPVHDRFANVEGMYAVPPPMTGNYMPSGPDREVDDSMFTYGPKQSKTSESDTQTSNFNSCESNSSVETLESVPEPVVVEPKVVSQPKVWSDAPIIEEYESDSDDEYVIQPSKEQERPSFAFVKHVKTPRETVKEQNTYSPSPKADKRDWNGLMSKRLGLGYGFTKKACFVCGSFSHLIRDCDFHEKRMAKQVELNKKKGKGTGQGENRPVWNNVQRLNHQNQFVPTAVLTRTGRIPVNTASHNFNSQAVSTSAARKVNAVRPIVNENRPRNNFHKSHSPIRRPFNRTTAPRTNFSNQKVNTAEVKAVSTIEGKRETADNPQRALKNKGIVDSGCSRHMTGNKAYLAEYQDYNGGPVAFGGSKGYITSKGKIKIGKLDFEDVCFVKELQHFNLFSVSQMCDKKNKVLFTDTECLVLSSDFKLPDENQVLLRIPRQNNMYSFNIENIVPSGGLACLIAKATIDESNKWHRRLGHVNFKNLNKLVKGNLVRGLPLKIFQNDHTCVACQKGKQHKASSGYHQKDRKPKPNDKTEHGWKKTVQNQGQSALRQEETSSLLQAPAPAPVKVVELSCVPCGGAHSHKTVPAHSLATPPGFPPVQNSQANNANNFNRGNNFNQNRESNFNQNRGGNFNQSNFSQNQLHRPQVNQSPAYQAPVPQTHGVSKTDFERYVTANDAVLRNMQNQALPGNTVTNPKEDLKGITTRSGVTIQGPKTVNHDTEVTKDTMPPANNGSTENVQPPVVQIQSRNPVLEPIVAPVVAPVPNTKPTVSLPYPSRRDNEKSRNQANEQIDKFYEIFKEMSFEISFTDALVLMPNSRDSKNLLGNKRETFEVARTSHRKTLGWDESGFIIADLADFVVVDFEPDPRVPLILGRCFLKTGRALIDVHKGELTLRIGSEAITYNLDQTSRYSANYTHMTANKIDVIDMACEEYSQEVLGFTDIIASGNSTPYYDPIVATSSPTLTPFGDSDFLLLEEADSFLG
ncbi:ribonuclease H-like domain-containing protein [Tanacetum coccineum]|uniref:Ribonuclease H-like domain-containing protein n=1 Tax=Tanacetum coccineum TaxID=301880 RepID=A0ABQ5BNY6_9ASTR